MPEEKKSNIIYHYYSLEAFHSIIKDKILRLFSLSSTNDINELSEAKRVIINILHSERKYKGIIRPYNSEDCEFYSLSCTSKKDSAFHFNKYADNDKGLCFGIDKEVFEKYLDNILMDLRFGCFFFPEVIYDDKQKEKMIKEYLDEKLSHIKLPRKKLEKDYKKEFIELNYMTDREVFKNLAYTTLYRFSPNLKIANYKDEAETRILFCKSLFLLCEQIYKNIFESKLNSDFSYKALLKPAEELNLYSQPKFEVMSGVMKKYIELKMNAIWNEQPIKEVILGPNCKTNIKEFNEFLKLNGVTCEAVKSHIINRI